MDVRRPVVGNYLLVDKRNRGQRVGDAVDNLDRAFLEHIERRVEFKLVLDRHAHLKLRRLTLVEEIRPRKKSFLKKNNEKLRFE